MLCVSEHALGEALLCNCFLQSMTHCVIKLSAGGSAPSTEMILCALGD